MDITYRFSQHLAWFGTHMLTFYDLNKIHKVATLKVLATMSIHALKGSLVDLLSEGVIKDVHRELLLPPDPFPDPITAHLKIWNIWVDVSATHTPLNKRDSNTNSILNAQAYQRVDIHWDGDVDVWSYISLLWGTVLYQKVFSSIPDNYSPSSGKTVTIPLSSNNKICHGQMYPLCQEILLYSTYGRKKITSFQTLWKQHVGKRQSVYFSSEHKRHTSGILLQFLY